MTLLTHGRGDLEALTEAVEELGDSYVIPWSDEEYYYPLEDGYIVLDDDVIESTESACVDLQSTSAALPFLGPEDPLVALTAVRDAVVAIVSAIEETGSLDRDSEAWRDDMQLLVDQLDSALSVTAAMGLPTLDFTADGDIALRMYWGSPLGCEPPLRLLALDPDYSLMREDPLNFMV